MLADKGDSPVKPAAARRILVVDDDTDFAEALGAVIEDAGYEVRLAFSASEGLASLGTFIPDVAIVDIRMPIVDGYALLAIFRAEQKLRDCKFIAMSGYRRGETRPVSTFDHFFTKPLEMSKLLATLDQHAPIAGPLLS